VPDNSAFITESLVASPLGWLNFAGGAPAASTNAVWKLRRTANGGFALFHATALTIGGTTPQTAVLATVTIEWRYQPAAASWAMLSRPRLMSARAHRDRFLHRHRGSAERLRLGHRGRRRLLALHQRGLRGRHLSARCLGKLYRPHHRADAPDYGAFLSGLTGPVPFSTALDDPNGPFLYNLAGDNRLSPTFNIYLIKVGTDVYKVQVIGYYSSTGAGGHPTIRYAKIQ